MFTQRALVNPDDSQNKTACHECEWEISKEEDVVMVCEDSHGLGQFIWVCILKFFEKINYLKIVKNDTAKNILNKWNMLKINEGVKNLMYWL